MGHSGDDQAEWLSILFPDDVLEEKRFVSLFVGYFDDSGRKDGPNPIAVVGGFVAQPREWLGFNHQWEKVLNKYGVDVHHQNKWSNRAKPFDQWREDRRRDYLNELISVITSREVVTIGAAVSEERFDTHFPGGRRIMSPFGFAAQCVFGATAEVIKKRVPDARIAYVFESGTLGFGEVQRAFDESLAIPSVKEEFGLVSLTQGEKSDFMQLQAADLMAYEVFKLYEKGDDPESWNARYPLREIGNRLPTGLWMTPSEAMVRYTASVQTLAELARKKRSP